MNIIAFDLAGGGCEVVGLQRRADVERRHAECRHAVGIEPDAHGEGLPAENFRVRHAADRLQSRLHHAIEVVADLRGRHHIGIESDVHERKALAGRAGNHRVVRLARQNALDLVDFRQHVRRRPVGIGIELEIEGHGADVLRRG